MKIKIIQTREFSKTLDILLKKRNLLQDDFDFFKKKLIEDPEVGDLIIGTGGVRKARLKSSTKGKSGGFRICYYYIGHKGSIYLLWIYPKSEQENLTTEEKNILKNLVKILKGTN